MANKLTKRLTFISARIKRHTDFMEWVKQFLAIDYSHIKPFLEYERSLEHGLSLEEMKRRFHKQHENRITFSYAMLLYKNIIKNLHIKAIHNNGNSSDYSSSYGYASIYNPGSGSGFSIGDSATGDGYGDGYDVYGHANMDGDGSGYGDMYINNRMQGISSNCAYGSGENDGSGKWDFECDLTELPNSPLLKQKT